MICGYSTHYLLENTLCDRGDTNISEWSWLPIIGIFSKILKWWMLFNLLSLSLCPDLIRIIWSIGSNFAFSPFLAWWYWNWQQQQNAKNCTSSYLDLYSMKKTALKPTHNFLLSNALLKQCCLHQQPVTSIFLGTVIESNSINKTC